LNFVNLVIKSFFFTHFALMFNLFSCKSDQQDNEITKLFLSLQKLYKEIEDCSMLMFISSLDIILFHKDC